jgi:hypothetical protein
MDYKGYISAAFKCKFNEFMITDNDIDFLFDKLLLWELIYGSFSVYKIYSFFKGKGNSIAYKNVHSKIQKLFAGGLIEEVEGKYLHGAIFYRISPDGWFNLILRGEFDYPTIYRGAATKYYSDNIIFKTFVYPYFEKKTINLFSDSTIAMYLYDCCKTTMLSIGDWERSSEIIFEVPKDKWLEHNINSKSVIDLNESIASALDLQIKSFLFKQIITNPKMQLVLSQDKKFMAAVEDIEKEFREGYNKLMQLKKNK